MANGLPPPARIPSSEAIRKAALARSARRGARVAAWRVTLRWLVWGFGQFLVGLGALVVIAAAAWGLRWAWQQGPSRPPEAPSGASAPASQPIPAASAAPAPEPRPAPTAEAPASAPDPSTPPRYPLRLDDAEPPPAAVKRPAPGAQSPSTRNTEPPRP